MNIHFFKKQGLKKTSTSSSVRPIMARSRHFPDPVEISLKGPIYLAKSAQYRMFTKSSRDPVTFASPLVCLSSVDRSRRPVLFALDRLGMDTQGLLHFLKTLELRIQKIHKRLHSDFHELPFRSCIHTWMGTQYATATVDWDRITVYDKSGDTQPLDCLGKGSAVRLLLWAKGVHAGPKYWCLQLEVLQIRLCEAVYPTRCLLMDNEDIPSACVTPATSSDSQSPYIRMLKMGIPREAVVQRCRIQGIDPAFLKIQGTAATGISVRGTTSQQPGLLAGIAGAKLRKTEPAPKPKPQHKSGNQHVPSLEEILGVRKRLRRRIV